MLTATHPTETTTQIYSFAGGGNELTETLLQNRATGKRVKLCIYSRNGLSMQETRQAIAMATNSQSFWDWRVISKISRYEPF